MQDVLEMAKKAAASPITVLLLGESGTGKEVLARALHHVWGDRRKGPFIPINCAALPTELLESELFGHERGAFTGATLMKKGKFELADGGTAFLDEIGDMAGDTQAKVLRFLQEQEFEHVGGTKTLHVNVRVVAATNRDLEKAMKEGKFREDLYYRLNVVALTLPPLRERKEDLDDLADYFLRRFAHEMKKPVTGFADDARDAFRNYSWPGNIRELSNVIERAVALTDAERITRSDLPPAIVEPRPAPSPSGPTEVVPYQEAVERAKQEAIRAALEATNGNQSRAAERLGVERTYLSRLMKQFGMR
jgi:transcriptional regulator with PAS, ATPase and Fis domain